MEAEKKYIKGPWQAQWSTRTSELRSKGWHVFNSDVDQIGVIAELPDHAGDNLEDYAITKATAHLIAAAPDLLEALNAFYSLVENAEVVSTGEDGKKLAQVYRQAFAALLKARGQ